ncbi:SDR family NAD(P)-dependent oxidoreductase [Galbitalea sp. SE-J8]|uniref:SDR family NAD(P)-dependent oxidoreductase n=1 Tax=Galbitalea sp. SE-J8 TaxID=3054952 RepID=UPI00259CF67A|nr:SDR family NAD(P)-dependent oxidoreductase [Galbitalea sp. SE-J8]MDM4761770.1 SDR family NAD(P)-dependent oxidoreductase [Galbitalea sp. SE-J8]
MATALVTGGTSGIGAEFARSLAARGYDLVLVARDQERLAGMASELSAVHVELLPADLADRADVARVVARLEDAARPVDVLVNNAGFGIHTSLVDPDLERIDLGWEVMQRAVLVLSAAAARGMRERGHGRIIQVSSTAGFITLGAYSAAKAWLTSISEALSNELVGTGVTVTALCPGWVHTEFHARAGIRKSSIPDFLWLQPGPLVEKSLRDAEKGRVISIPSVRYGVLIWFARHLPKGVIRRISRSISSARSAAAAAPATGGRA